MSSIKALSRMKIVSRGPRSDKVTISVQMEKELRELLDKLADAHGASRQRLIVAILKTAVHDPKFTLDLTKLI